MSTSIRPGPVVELGPGTGAITNALIERGVDQKRLVLVEYNPGFCALLRDRYPHAKVVQGDAYTLRDSLLECAERARHPPWCPACRSSPSRC